MSHLARGPVRDRMGIDSKANAAHRRQRDFSHGLAYRTAAA
jgi:hypothetical protein